MAFYRGEEGSVKFDDAGSSAAAITSTRSWSLTLDKEVTLVDINDIVKITTLPRNLVNNVTDFLRTAEDVKLGFAISSVCKKYFGVESDYLGYVNYDEGARESVSRRQPIVDLQHDADVSIYIQRIARKLLGLPSASSSGPATGTGGRR